MSITATIKKLSKRWFIDAMGGMAMGLFATLIAGTIFEQIAKLLWEGKLQTLLFDAARVAKFMLGAGIGAGVAHALKADKLTLFSAIVAGMLGANGSGFNPIAVAVGNPIGAYLAALAATEICLLIAGKTKLDIVVIPLTAMIVAVAIVLTLCPPVTWLVKQIARGIELAVGASPFVMGIVIAVTMGIILTMPTSSAAIWVMICASGAANNGGVLSPELLLASGAAAVGCAAQMVGFAVSSFRENKWSGLIAQGLGTSMLQIPNIMKKPAILIPPTVASAVVGPLATTVFKLKCNGPGGGMGTSGLVGVIQTIVESAGTIPTYKLVLGIIFLFFVIPAVVSLATSELLRHFGVIKYGDMKLEL